MRSEAGDYQIDDDLSRVDLKRVTEWLAGSYWSPGIGREEVEKGARNSSLVIGAYDPQGVQVGYARLASDKTRFAYVMDVIVEPSHRRKGLGQAMVRFAMDHPDHQAVYIWLLATHDAHGAYAKVGFKPLEHPDRWMALVKPRPKA